MQPYQRQVFRRRRRQDANAAARGSRKAADPGPGAATSPRPGLHIVGASIADRGAIDMNHWPRRTRLGLRVGRACHRDNQVAGPAGSGRLPVRQSSPSQCAAQVVQLPLLGSVSITPSSIRPGPVKRRPAARQAALRGAISHAVAGVAPQAQPSRQRGSRRRGPPPALVRQRRALVLEL